jgi:hypothetical protein
LICTTDEHKLTQFRSYNPYSSSAFTPGSTFPSTRRREQTCAAAGRGCGTKLALKIVKIIWEEITMTQTEIQHQLYDEIDKLSATEQLRLLAAAREMKSVRLEGTPWSKIKHLAGTMPDEDAEEIIAAIEEGCETIDLDGW